MSQFIIDSGATSGCDWFWEGTRWTTRKEEARKYSTMEEAQKGLANVHVRPEARREYVHVREI